MAPLWHYRISFAVSSPLLRCSVFSISASLNDNVSSAPSSRLPWSHKKYQLTATTPFLPLLLPLLLLVFLSLLPASCSAQYEWLGSTQMTTARLYHGMANLNDGRVLVAGGSTASLGSNSYATITTAEIHSFNAGTWTSAGALGVGRSFVGLGVEPTSGKAFAIGGFDSNSNPSAAIDMWDPSTSSFSPGVPRYLTRGQHTLLWDIMGWCTLSGA